MIDDSEKNIISLDKWMGSIIGLAIGDQLGSLTEGKTRGSFEKVRGMDPGTFWTDDTSQALCLADSLISTKKFDLTDQLERYSKWLFEGYLSAKEWGYGCGPTARLAINNFIKKGKPSPVRNQSTNGALMRLCPVPLYYSNNLEEAIDKSGESAKSTHDNPICVDACRLYGSMIVKAVQKKDKDFILEYDQKLWINNPLEKSIDIVAQGSYKEKNLSEIKGTLNISESIEAALWTFAHSSSFAEGALMAVNMGDDADTTAAIFGQLAGGFYGYEAIPTEWRAKLLEKELIEYIANKLYESRKI